jgi:hypothetical protein
MRCHVELERVRSRWAIQIAGRVKVLLLRQGRGVTARHWVNQGLSAPFGLLLAAPKTLVLELVPWRYPATRMNEASETRRFAF